MSEQGAGSDLQIVDLRQKPAFGKAVVDQNMAQWSSFTDLDRAGMELLFPTRNDGARLPATLIAIAGRKLMGLVSLRETTMGAVKHPEAYMDASPWLSNMWVADFARGRGLAKRLTTQLAQCARELGFDALYSSTFRDDSLYHQCGFRTIAHRDHRDTHIYIIKLDLA